MPLHVVAEMSAYLARADHVGMSDEDRQRVVEALAKDPEAGDLIRGTGGVRKLRVAREGEGKSGGWRVLSVYLGPNRPVYLISVFAKKDRANVSMRDRNSLAKLIKILKEQ